MALTDERKLEVVQSALKQKILEFQDWAAFKTFLQNVTKAQLKTFILNALQAEEAKFTQFASDHSTTATDLDELYTELDTDM